MGLGEFYRFIEYTIGNEEAVIPVIEEQVRPGVLSGWYNSLCYDIIITIKELCNI